MCLSVHVALQGDPVDTRTDFEKLLEKTLAEDPNAQAIPLPADGGSTPRTEDYESMSLEDRLVSSKWEARVHGVRELQAGGKTLDTVKPVLSDLAAMLNDKNANVQREVVDLWGHLLVTFDADLLRRVWTESIKEQLLHKSCMTQPKTQQGSFEMLIIVTSILADNTVLDDIVTSLTKFIDTKGTVSFKGGAATTKLAAALLLAGKQLLAAFGLSNGRLKFNALIDLIKPFVSYSDRTVKEAAYTFAVEVYRWCRNLDIVRASIEAKQITVRPSHLPPCIHACCRMRSRNDVEQSTVRHLLCLREHLPQKRMLLLPELKQVCTFCSLASPCEYISNRLNTAFLYVI